MRTWFLVFLSVALTTACHTKDEARVLVSAVDAFRAASNDDKPKRADALDKVECTDPEICDAKTACTKSADATAKGLRLQHEVQEFAKTKTGDPDVLAEKWKQGSDDLTEGFNRLEDCRAKTRALKERFGI